ncbi:MaoC/PaaZ C-terminal domain-containing protein [Amorphus sp. 3PC139-8]|uniref:MaoC/PaaZ C-terminal domain-containing protein n=1 Tax=Amorphus sp. 3PC139-8 TaxID=2735676 RepID=UPI00345CE249
MSDLSYDTLSENDHLVGAGRTIRDADLSMACMISGDWHPIHCDDQYARRMPTGRPLLHGGYLTALTMGMSASLLAFKEPVVMLLGLEQWTFRAPVGVGDTLHLEMRLLSKRRTSTGTRGVLKFQQNLLNEKDAVVLEGVSAHLVGDE